MDQQNQIQQELMKELGLENLPEDKQRELIAQMTEVVLKRIFVETMEKLNETDQEAYGQMIDKGASPEEVDTFLGEKIPDYEKMIQNIIVNFKEEMKKN